MADTHDYPTRKVRVVDLDNTMTLVGESGGLSSIYGAFPAPTVDLIGLKTEHGSLFLRVSDESGMPALVDVLDLEEPEEPDIKQVLADVAEQAERTKDVPVRLHRANPRPLWKIAREAEADWGDKVYFGAKPYLEAMRSLTTLDVYYGLDSADDIVRRFLANASTWRGDVARRVKAELRAMLADFDKKRG